MTDLFEYDVFLSFASEDEELVKPIWQELSLSGLRVFWSDTSLKKELGDSWFQVIQNSLERSRHMLLICTSTSLNKMYVKMEYQAFINDCFQPGVRRLIPVLAKDFQDHDLPLFLKTFEAVSSDDPNYLQDIIPLIGGVSIEKLQIENQKLRQQIETLQQENSFLRNEKETLQNLLQQERKERIARSFSEGLVAINQKFNSLRKTLRRSFQQHKRIWLSVIRIVIILASVALITWGAYRSGILRPLLEPSLRLVNHLENSVSVYIDGSYQGKLDTDTEKIYYVDEFPVEVSFNTIRSTTTAGTSIGDYMSGSWSSVGRWKTLNIESTISGKMYFYPIVSNELDSDCSITVNEGYKSENSPGAVVGSSKTVQFGYYQLFKNSNVVFTCKDGTTYWWGERNGQISQENPLYQMLEGVNGILRITLK